MSTPDRQRHDRTAGRLGLPPLALRHLVVAKARATFRALHPHADRDLRDFEHRPMVIYLAVGADFGADERAPRALSAPA